MPDESRSYYGAGEQLMYFNRQVGWSTPGEGTGVFEEYRYDALGRRVYSRARRTSSCSYPCEAYVQRTVWDGPQVLAEIRSSGKDSVASTYMDGEGSVASGDGSDLYGIVLYANAGGIDQPVGILKKYASGWAYVTPHANWKGEWTYGTYDAGGTCYTATSVCPAWPGYYLSADRDTQGATRATYSVWWGSLIQNQADGSGLLYQRNRYYDPKTGRFTQLDPIGLGGGLNLYGFAGGDPANFSDPMGTCTPWPDCWFQGIADWGARRGGSLGGAALNIGAGLNAASEALGANDFGRAVANRDVIGGAVAFAGMLPIGKLGKVAKVAREFEGVALTAREALEAGEMWVGKGYRQIGNGVWRSADNAWQFRMTTSDLVGDLKKGMHVHFETIGKDGKEILESMWSKIRP